jgi:hypothetical protein
MCHYITAVLPETVDIDKHRDLFKHYDRDFQPQENKWIEAKIDESARYYSTTKHRCDCGTVIGISNRGRPDNDLESKIEKEIVKLKRKGWSNNKIKRWREEKLKAAANRIDFLNRVEEAYEELAQEWVDFINAFFDQAEAGYIGLLLHMYSGQLSGRIELKNTVNIKRQSTTPLTIMNMDEDVLYYFES